ncbi:MAG: large conductance mechanosensitive channel protein MscL [Ruminococcus sp.]|nr:large conductance mechanosensitive channel protein MscL [Ruminococcus sp.]
MKKFFGEFKEFIMRGNVMDLAVAVIIGAAFGAIVTALCDKIITPLIQLIIGSIFGKSIDEMTSVLNVGPIEFGAFISAVINFIIMALIIFLMVKAVNKAMAIGKKKEEEEEEATTKECPYCKSEIAIVATRCPHCTSQLEEEKK